MPGERLIGRRLRWRAGLAVVLIAGATIPPASTWLEARLVTHVLVQYPLLIAAGALIGAASGRRADTGWTAAPAFLTVAFALAFWLLPRWIDASLSDPAMRAAKFVSLIILAGLPLGWGWAQAGPVLRGFILSNGAAMAAVMGWLQIAIPQRLCNAYLASDQRILGIGFLYLAAALFLTVALSAFFSAPRRDGEHHRRPVPVPPAGA